jgi:hypothetical protein
MFSESESLSSQSAKEKRRSALHPGATNCTAFLVGVARLRWPHKTALHWAAASGVKERMAKYWLSGRYPVSDGGTLALIRELQERQNSNFLNSARRRNGSHPQR